MHVATMAANKKSDRHGYSDLMEINLGCDYPSIGQWYRLIVALSADAARPDDVIALQLTATTQYFQGRVNLV